MTDSAVRNLISEAIRAEHQGQFAEACARLRQAVAAGDRTSLGLDAGLRLGKLLVYTGDYDAAGPVLTQARQQAEEAGAIRQAATAIHLLGLLERRRFRYDEALRILEESPVKHPTESPTAETGQWWHYRGLIAADQGDQAQGERMLYRAHMVYQERHDRGGLAEVCDSLANLLLRRGKTRAALIFVDRSLKLKREVGDRYGEAISLGTQGRAYLLQARYEDAARAFTDDLAIARELGDTPGVGLTLNQLGQIAYLRKDFPAAVAFYQRSLKESPGPFNSLHTHLGLGWVHLAAGRLDQAAHECDQVAALLAQHPRVHGLGEALLGLRGAIAWRRGAVEDGEGLLLRAVEELERQKQSLDTIPLLYELRDLYHGRQYTAKAVRTMSRALDLLHECGDERGVRDLENWLRTVDSPSLIHLALEQHFPDFLVESILCGGLSRPPTRTQDVTVLFSDIRDYTTLSEGLPAEKVVELLNEWFTEATRVIRRHNGVVDKFIGDAIMALFGVPEPRADAAADAVRAALELREELLALNLRQKALGGREIRIGVGIDSGAVVLGFIGSHLRQSYTVIGDTVNVASRIESETKQLGCDILISGETQARQEGFGVGETSFLGDVKVKGRNKPVAVFQVKGRLQARAGAPAQAR